MPARSLPSKIACLILFSLTAFLSATAVFGENPLFQTLHYEISSAGLHMTRGDFDEDGFQDLAAVAGGEVNVY